MFYEKPIYFGFYFLYFNGIPGKTKEKHINMKNHERWNNKQTENKYQL